MGAMEIGTTRPNWGILAVGNFKMDSVFKVLLARGTRI